MNDERFKHIAGITYENIINDLYIIIKEKQKNNENTTDYINNLIEVMAEYEEWKKCSNEEKSDVLSYILNNLIQVTKYNRCNSNFITNNICQTCGYTNHTNNFCITGFCLNCFRFHSNPNIGCRNKMYIFTLSNVITNDIKLSGSKRGSDCIDNENSLNNRKKNRTTNHDVNIDSSSSSSSNTNADAYYINRHSSQYSSAYAINSVNSTNNVNINGSSTTDAVSNVNSSSNTDAVSNVNDSSSSSSSTDCIKNVNINNGVEKVVYYSFFN
jgi:hypothetical protein